MDVGDFMNRKDYLLELRQEGKLKGKKPCFITLKLNKGRIYNLGTADFIMSYKDDTLYFQRLSLFFKTLKPKLDFTLNAKRFVEYKFTKKQFMTMLTLYDTAGMFIEIYFQTGTKETYATEDNIYRILRELEAKGLKEIKGAIATYEEGNDTGSEESN